ncbi:MAG: phosphotransferase [Leptospiraceae bacterium]|nr:phosphotransferase [Leptospiraceae bacterium]
MAINSTEIKPQLPVSQIKAMLAEAHLGELEQIQPVRIEASTRRYFRIHVRQSGRQYLLCEGLPKPYHDQDGFIQLNAFLEKNGITVPRIHAVNRMEGALLLSDGGSNDLTDFLNHCDRDDSESQTKRIAALQTALGLVARIQRLEPPSLVASRLFDFEKLDFEMQYLYTALDACCQTLQIPDPASYELKYFLTELCKRLAGAGEFVICHRDFHGRNLIYQKDPAADLVLIDFQDARMGLPFYDVASLLYDPYTALTAAERETLLLWFTEQLPAEHRPGCKWFYLIAAQRVLKALGTYLNQIYNNGNATYLASVPSALRNLEDITQRGHLPDSLYHFGQHCQVHLIPRLSELLPVQQQ